MRKKILSGSVPWKLVEVIWDDAEAQTGWAPIPEKPKHAVAVSIGFLVSETEDHIVIASTVTSGEYCTNQRLQIPRGMCLSIRTLQEKGP